MPSPPCAVHPRIVAGTISNLTITATASPAATNLLHPGGTGDVVVTISNPNAFSVPVTGVNLPTNSTYAAGFSDSSLSTPQAGCSAATPSTVTCGRSRPG